MNEQAQAHVERFSKVFKLKMEFMAVITGGLSDAMVIKVNVPEAPLKTLKPYRDDVTALLQDPALNPDPASVRDLIDRLRLPIDDESLDSLAAFISFANREQLDTIVRWVAEQTGHDYSAVRSRMSVPPGGVHYLKVSKRKDPDSGGQTFAEEEERLQAYDEMQRTVLNSVMPPLVAYGQDENGDFLAALYGLAQPGLFEHEVGSLARILHEQQNADTAAMRVQQLVRSLVAWNREAAPGSAVPVLPFVRDVMGRRRWDQSHSDQTVFDRTAALFARNRDRDFQDIAADLGRFRLIRIAQIDHNTLPNPVAYLYNEAWWGDQHVIPILGRTHGDLHTGNIIVPRYPGNRNVTPDIIDFSDYEAAQSVFFDYLYLEVDLMLRKCSPAQPLNRDILFGLLADYLMHDEREIAPEMPDLDEHRYKDTLTALLRMIRPLRTTIQQEVMRSVNDQQRTYVYTAFWLTAVAVGLNFLRKSTIAPAERVFGLVYAAVALRNALTLLDLRDYEAASETFPVDWRDSLGHEPTDPRYKQVELDDVVAEIGGILADPHAPGVVLVCAPGLLRAPEEHEPAAYTPDLVRAYADVHDEIERRLRWFNVNDRRFSTYAELTSDTNLRVLLERANRHPARSHPVTGELETNQLKLLINWLAPLVRSTPVTVATFDYDPWLYEQIAQQPFTPDTDPGAAGVYYLRGATRLPGSINRESFAGLRQQVEAGAHVVFLGFDAGHPLLADDDWCELLARNRRIWLVQADNIDTMPNLEAVLRHVTLGVNTDVPRFPDAGVFLRRLLDHLDLSAADETHFVVTEPVPPVNQQRALERVKQETDRPVFLESPVGEGKSTFLRHLRSEHERRMGQLVQQQYERLSPAERQQGDAAPYDPAYYNFCAIIDLNAVVGSGADLPPEERRYREQMAVAFLLYDHFRIQPPAVPDRSIMAERFPLIMFHFRNNLPRCVRNLDTRSDKRLLICFDNVPHNGDGEILRWCDDLFKRLTYSDEKAFALLLARRLDGLQPAEDTPPMQRLYLDDLDTTAVEELMEHYHVRAGSTVNRVEWDAQRQKQADRYTAIAPATATITSLVSLHAKNGFGDIGKWPGHDMVSYSFGELSEALWTRYVACEFTEPEWRPLLRDVFLCRHLTDDLLAELLADHDAVDTLLMQHPLQAELWPLAKDRLLDARLVITTRQLPDWEGVPVASLHYATRYRCFYNADCRTRMVEVLWIALRHVEARINNLVADPISGGSQAEDWYHLVTDAIYYHFLLALPPDYFFVASAPTQAERQQVEAALQHIDVLLDGYIRALQSAFTAGGTTLPNVMGRLVAEAEGGPGEPRFAPRLDRVLIDHLREKAAP